MISPVERGVYLASSSPRRRELLAQVGVRFHLLLFRSRPGEDPDVDEDALPNEAPDVYVLRLARSKAEAGWRRMLQRNLPHANPPRAPPCPPPIPPSPSTARFSASRPIARKPPRCSSAFRGAATKC